MFIIDHLLIKTKLLIKSQNKCKHFYCLFVDITKLISVLDLPVFSSISFEVCHSPLPSSSPLL